jgi:hypothetical protein
VTEVVSILLSLSKDINLKSVTAASFHMLPNSLCTIILLFEYELCDSENSVKNMLDCLVA